jgi:hypothetical protein
MWTTIALMAALSLAPQQQAGTLTLANVRASYGAPGLPRIDTHFLPGDQLVIAFDIEGITIDPNGKVLYAMGTELTDSKGKVVFRQEPRDLETVAALGGSSVPGMVALDIGLDQPAGDYTVKVTVLDRASKRTGTLTRAFQVLPAGFGIVRLTTTTDPEGRAPASIFQTGGSLWINTGVVGYARKEENGQPDVEIDLRLLDEAGKPTMAQPFVGVINDNVPSNTRFLPVQFLVVLNRPGKFTAELKATCRLCKKTQTLALPITVLPSK